MLASAGEELGSCLLDFGVLGPMLIAIVYSVSCWYVYAHLFVYLCCVVYVFVVYLCRSQVGRTLVVDKGRGGCKGWQDAVRGARWVLEYLELLRDIWASELTSQCFIRESVKT